MGLETELEFDKYCKVVRNPKVGRQSHHHKSKSGARFEKGRLSTRNYLLRNLDDDFTEITFGRSRSSSCKNTAYVPAVAAGNEVFDRGSVYCSSKEVRMMKKCETVEGRQKIEFSPGSDASLSFRIFDSSLSDKTCPFFDKKRPTLLSLSENTNPSSDVRDSYTELEPQDISFRFPSTPASSITRSMSSDGPVNICIDLKDRTNTSGAKERCLGEQPRFKCDQTLGPLNDGNDLLEKDAFFALHKSSSEKAGRPCSPSQTESDNSKDSPKSRFSPFRRMWDPIMKSKSLRSSPVSKEELGQSTFGLEKIKRNKTFRKSLLKDFSNAVRETECGTRILETDQNKVVSSSPAHLHGLLTLELKHGVPYFEFSFDDLDDVLSAKTWRANNAFSGIYTFYSMNNRKTSNSSGWGARERRKESSIIGQMQVSCFLLSEMRNGGTFDNSTVTEFVLYDIMHARNDIMHERKTFSAEDSCDDSTKSIETKKVTCIEDTVTGGVPFELNGSCDLVNPKQQTGNFDYNASTHYPWAPQDLHPSLEIAAIVIQVPFEKGDCVKDKQGDMVGEKKHPNLFDFSAFDHKRVSIPRSINRAKMKVVTPAGAHGLPSKKAEGAPSPLLERWRSGGSCDCGGWDMACPLLVFDNCNGQKTKDIYLENQQPVELFLQGAKDNIPALTIRSTTDGQYSVDFHARLSKLQAFSMCVAILHGCEASTAVEQEKNTQNFHCNSLKVLLSEEAKFLMEAVADKDKRSVIARA